jgi:hypothetical protein
LGFLILRSGSGGGGSLADGASATISGSGFGTNSVSQEFLGGVNGVIEGLANNASWTAHARSNWTFPGAEPQQVSTDRSLSGTKSLANLNWASDNFQFGSKFDTGGYKAIYTRFSYYLHQSPADSALQNKLDRYVCGPLGTDEGIEDSNLSNTYFIYFRGGAGDFDSSIAVNGGSAGTLYPENGGGTGGPWGLTGTGTWITKEVVFKPDSSAGAGDGSIQWRVIREDTRAVLTTGSFSSRNFWGSTHGATPFRYWVLYGYLGNGVTNGSVYWDRDIYCAWQNTDTTTPKYVLLGDASTYAGSTIFSVSPHTSWSDTTIQVTVNKGQHSNLTGKYWYVMSAPGTPINSNGIAA